MLILTIVLTGCGQNSVSVEEIADGKPQQKEHLVIKF
jgi:hypothetical protein